jgi:hypothetical protein
VQPLNKDYFELYVTVQECEDAIPMRIIIFAVFAIVHCLHAPATAEMYTIDNPAEKIHNPADKMYNPATQENNPSSNIYNPSTRMNKKNPLSPPTQSVLQPTAKEIQTVKEPALQTNKQQKPQVVPTIANKSYHFKSVKEYINSAKKTFTQKDYKECISVTEDALRRISAGTLKASKKSKRQLVKYKNSGYELLMNKVDVKD